MLPVLRRRALTPGPALHLSGGLWPGNHIHDNALNMHIRQDALHSVLPSFTRRLDGLTYNTDSLIEQLIVDSPELWPRTKWNYLDADDLRRVYYWIIKAQSRSPYDETDGMVRERLMESLERSFQHDRSSALSINAQFFHIRAQRLFRSLAEVSRQTESRRIGSALASWFMSRVTHIVTADHYLALGQWCYAILRATMQESDRRECLLALLQGCPDLSSRLVGRGVKAEEVARCLQVIQRLSVRRNADVQSNNIFLGRSRAHELLVDMEWPAARGRMIRSRSHNGRALGPLGSLERRAGLLDIGGQGRAERALLEQEGMAAQEQRLLHLNITSRFADHRGRHDDMGLDFLALGDHFGVLEGAIEDSILI